MRLQRQKWLFPVIVLFLSTVFSSSVFAEAVGGKNGFLKKVSHEQFEEKIHKDLIKRIRIDNPQPPKPYTAKQTHWHPPIWGCVKARSHKHQGARNHQHKYNCPKGRRGAFYNYSHRPRPVMRRAAPAPAAAKPQSSTTNTQEKGVDEDDLVKTDGRYLFAIYNDDYGRNPSGVRILDSKTNKVQPKQIAAIGFEKGIRLSGMYIMPKRNRLIIIGQRYGARSFGRRTNYYGSAETSLITVDITNRKKPKVIQHVKLEGSPKETRRIGDRLYVILTGGRISNYPETYKRIETPKKMNDKQLDVVRQSMITKIKQWKSKSSFPQYRVIGQRGIKPIMTADSFYTNPGDKYSNFNLTSLLAIDLKSTSFKFKSLGFFGYPGTFYASDKAMYITANSYALRHSLKLDSTRFPKNISPKLIHKFAFNKRKGFDYRGTGAVLGELGWNKLSSFQMDEDKRGNLRVVTKNWASRHNKKGDPAAGSPVILTVLAEHPRNKQLITTSRLPNRRYPKPLGKPGEDLYGARLFNDYAYFVTFRQTDPLYVVDMRNPRNLRVVGELEIPGFSDYLHPIGTRLLLGVGKDAGKDGRIKGMKLSLFDISNPRKPREVHKVFLGERGTDSAASRDSHAFTSLKMRNSSITRVALPVTLVRGKNYQSENGLQQFEINAKTRKIKHVGELPSPKVKNQYWYWNAKDRSIIIGNKVYYYKNGNFWAGKWGYKKSRN